MRDIVIRPIGLGDIEPFGRMTGAVMREREYLAFVEPFPLDECAAFVARNLRLGNPHYVAADGAALAGGATSGARRSRCMRTAAIWAWASCPTIAVAAWASA